MRLPPPPPVARVAAATPPGRDRVLDLLRALALTVVVVGHTSMGVVGWSADGPRVRTALDFYPWAQWATWALQIMPLFFLAGAAANARSWRATTLEYAPWLWRRVARLLRPVWVYLIIMAPLAAIASWLLPEGWADVLLGLATQLLWFVGAYMIVCALTPVLVRGHAAAPKVSAALWLIGAAGVDVLRIGVGISWLGLLNFVLVWAFTAQLGLLWDAGSLASWRGVVVAAAAVGTNLLLIGAGPYPVSMVGGSPGERFSNMSPPSLALALHALALAGIAGAARPALAALARQRAPWTAATAVNLTAMTLYLWHLPVLVVLLGLTHALGWDRPVTWTDAGPAPAPGYWWWTVAFVAVDLLVVAAVVRVLWVAEVGRLPWWDRPARTDHGGLPGTLQHRRADAAAAAGAVLAGIGTLMLAATGLAGFPTRVTHQAGVPLNAVAAIALMLAGGALVRRAGTQRQESHSSGFQSRNPALP